MNQNFTEELNEGIRLITIERKLGKMDITSAEVDFIIKLANEKRYPRAEYVLAMMYLKGIGVERSKSLGVEYLEKCSEHSSYEIQLKLAYVFYVLNEHSKILICLERAIEDCRILC